tara:strand:+ start:11 stop:379 length:369 start_codon:yes stop_codon:yes gene_type:complete
MIPYPHPHNEHHHNENIKEWWAYETNSYLQDRLRNLILKVKYSKSTTKGWKLSSNDLEIHQVRMERYLNELDKIDKHLKLINIHHSPKRTEIIKQSIINIQQLTHNNYEHKTISRTVQVKKR